MYLCMYRDVEILRLVFRGIFSSLGVMDPKPLIRSLGEKKNSDITLASVLIWISLLVSGIPNIVGMSHCGVIQSIHNHNLITSVADILTSLVVNVWLV